jgi:hypothetical protein
VIQSLAHTVGADRAIIAQFDQFRKKRNIGGADAETTVRLVKPSAIRCKTALNFLSFILSFLDRMHYAERVQGGTRLWGARKEARKG